VLPRHACEQRLNWCNKPAFHDFFKSKAWLMLKTQEVSPASSFRLTVFVLDMAWKYRRLSSGLASRSLPK
jgi:hypothetical protein